MERLVDSVTVALDKHYIFPEKSKAIATYLRTRLKQKAYKGLTDPAKISAQLQTDIYFIHRDPHMHVYYEPAFAANLVAYAKTPPPPDTMLLYRERTSNFAFKRTEILNGNIGYVEFTGFSGFVNEAKPTLTAAFRFVANTEALIIDLRNNGGGSPWMVQQISSYLVKERTRLNDIYERRSNKTAEFWADPKEAENMKLSMPLYILTSDNTFSAAEDFTYAMQVNKRAIIVGDTTGGGAHPTGPVPVGQGFIVDIPFARSINQITQTDWEGVGILPDYPCNGSEALIKAQQLIFEEKLRHTTKDDQKAYYQWFIHALNAREYDNTVESNTLKAYEGEYGDTERFKVYVKENKLYVDDFNGRTFLLKPITPTRFLGSDWFQVEFLSSSGKVTQMKMAGKPGWVNVHDRVK